jgi:excisionase family DNA binding protein
MTAKTKATAPRRPSARKRPRKRPGTPQAHRTATPSADTPMETLLSLSEAGKLVGVSKSTIWRAVKSGKLSAAAKTDEGELRIEPSELHRAFAETKRAHAVASMVKGDEATAARLEGLEQMLAFAKEQLDKTEKDRDAWRDQAEGAQRLLTDARSKRFSWFRRGQNE